MVLMKPRDSSSEMGSAECFTQGREPVSNASFNPPEFRVCGVKIHAVQVDDVLANVSAWMEGERAFHYVCSTNANNVSIAMESPEYFQVIEDADLSLPDGVPFLWYGRLKGFPLKRNCGLEEVMEAIFETSNHGLSYSHFFYGNTPAVLDSLKIRLLQHYPNLVIAGMHSPPFRTLTPEEVAADIRMINDSGADFVWVSLGCPKQEHWLRDHRDALSVVVGGGAGAIFNILAGDQPKAPAWVNNAGLRWAFRLMMEPKRLFSRYCIRYPKFVVRFAWRSLRGI
jgi:N-acetylglucosaminyldiphosphoundecaprenol N-acetyl-beta-D-mannosaminyltransferase